MVNYYMLTLDQVCMAKRPTKESYKKLLLYLKKKFELNLENVFCYEFKKKTSDDNKWLHYHGIVSCKSKLKYKDFIVTGYSIDLQYCKTIKDLLVKVRYICKLKTDKVDCQLNNHMFIKMLSNIYS